LDPKAFRVSDKICDSSIVGDCAGWYIVKSDAGF
jgi:hypothetical protein